MINVWVMFCFKDLSNHLLWSRKPRLAKKGSTPFETIMVIARLFFSKSQVKATLKKKVEKTGISVFSLFRQQQLLLCQFSSSWQRPSRWLREWRFSVGRFYLEIMLEGSHPLLPFAQRPQRFFRLVVGICSLFAGDDVLISGLGFIICRVLLKHIKESKVWSYITLSPSQTAQTSQDWKHAKHSKTQLRIDMFGEKSFFCVFAWNLFGSKTIKNPSIRYFPKTIDTRCLAILLSKPTKDSTHHQRPLFIASLHCWKPLGKQELSNCAKEEVET